MMSVVDVEKGEEVIQHQLEGDVISIKILEDKRFLIQTEKSVYLVDVSHFTNPKIISTFYNSWCCSVGL